MNDSLYGDELVCWLIFVALETKSCAYKNDKQARSPYLLRLQTPGDKVQYSTIAKVNYKTTSM